MDSGSILGPYRIESLLGRSDSGCVFGAVDPDGRKVAIKALRLPVVPDCAELVERFLWETARVKHARVPGLIQHHGAGADDTGVWVAVDRRPEPSLAMRFASGTPARDDVMAVIGALAATLDECHARGIVPRNFRPTNVLGSWRRPILTDVVDVRRLSAELSGSEIPRARALWAAPEVILGYQQSAASNRYVLALLAYRCLTGHLPHDGANTLDYLYSVVYREPGLEAIDDEGLEDVFRRGLAPDPRIEVLVRDRVRGRDAAGRRAAAEASGWVAKSSVRSEPVEIARLGGPAGDSRRSGGASREEGVREVETPVVAPPDFVSRLTADDTAAGTPDDAPPGVFMRISIGWVSPGASGHREHGRELSGEGQAHFEPGLVRQLLSSAIERLPGVRMAAAGGHTSTFDDHAGQLADPSGEIDEARLDEIYIGSPLWSLEVRSPRLDSTVWVDDVLMGPANETLKIRGRSGQVVKVELRKGRRRVAVKRMRLHPFMDRVWEPEPATRQHKRG